MTTGDGISFSVKELLGQQDKKLDRILDRLETKADMTAVTSLDARISEIESHGSRQAIQANKELAEALRRISLLEKSQSDNAYLVEQYKADHKKIEEIEDSLIRLNNGFSTKITEAIDRNNEKIDRARQQMFSRKEKILLVTFAGIGAIGTLVSIAVVLIQFGLGGT